MYYFLRVSAISIFAISFMSDLALSDDTSDIKSAKICAATDNSGKRLICYDGVFRTNRIVSSEKYKSSKWIQLVDKSKITDQINVRINLESSEEIPRTYRMGRSFVDLSVRCLENNTSIYFIWGGYFLADISGYGQVTYRIDKLPAHAVSMYESSDHKALGLWRGHQAIPFIKSLFGHHTLVVRITPYNESPQEVTFNITGLETASKQLRKTCGW